MRKIIGSLLVKTPNFFKPFSEANSKKNVGHSLFPEIRQLTEPVLEFIFEQVPETKLQSKVLVKKISH